MTTPIILQAAETLVRRHEVKNVAQRLLKSVNTLRHEVTGTGTAKLGLEDAFDASIEFNDPEILLCWAREMGFICYQAAGGFEGDCARPLATLLKEVGEYASAVVTADSDGRISDNEVLDTERELSHVIHALQAVQSCLRARNKAGKPAHLREVAA